ncbi:MAG: RsmD family RNA methyltransferase [Planctomycetota bacterium]|jgi:16S rRNA (guanine(966)-N(2))-methyltransferase RsmD|nr:RsmD family RNA methyltransferase [Planctomycetota bacterium]
MRIISGSARGREIKVSAKARPYLAKVRAAIFNSLAARLDGAAVLDLYAGSGVNGIEALSRGAASAVLVDNARDAAAMMKENLARCACAEKAEIRLMEVGAFLRQTRARFDLIFIDPPFADDEAARARYGEWLNLAGAALRPDGRVIFRREIIHPESPLPACDLTVARDKNYGRSRVVFYRNKFTTPSANELPC